MLDAFFQTPIILGCRGDKIPFHEWFDVWNYYNNIKEDGEQQRRRRYLIFREIKRLKCLRLPQTQNCLIFYTHIDTQRTYF